MIRITKKLQGILYIIFGVLISIATIKGQFVFATSAGLFILYVKTIRWDV